MAFAISALPAHTIFYLPATEKTEAQPYIEFYWQIDPGTVAFGKDSAGVWLGKIITEIAVWSDTGTIVEEKYILQTTPAGSLLAAQLQNIMDMHRYMVPPGVVHMKLILKEYGNEQNSYQYEDSVEIHRPENICYYSQLQLLDTSYKTDLAENIYLKHGTLQVPLCLNFLDDYKKILHYYIELSGTDKIPADELPLIQQSFVSKKQYDFPVAGLTRADTIQPGTILPIRGRFKINALPSGNYHLNITLSNSKGQVLTRQTLFFQRINTKPEEIKDTVNTGNADPVFEQVNVFDLSSTFVGKYDISQLKAIIKMLKPIATETELVSINSFIDRPDETYMRYFVYNFWQTHAPDDPEKGWKDYTKRVIEVNNMFRSGGQPGYETERGFYYLKYGEPDQRYVVTAEQGALPYEVWQYNAPGNQSNPGSFLFYNPGFMGNGYTLLHSTVKGEMRNTNWRANLYRGGNSVNNLNSRAEQIFQNN